MPCTISNFTNGSYAKYTENESQMIMEYAPFTNYLAKYLPEKLSSNIDFVEFLLGEKIEQSQPMLFNYADILMYTLPSRY